MDGGSLRDRRIGELLAGDSDRWIAGRVIERAADASRFRLTDASGSVEVESALPLPPHGAWLRARGRLVEAGRFVAVAIEVLGRPAPRANESFEWADPQWRTHKRAALVARDRLLAAIRDRLRGDGFLEVETPTLLEAPGQEPHLLPFATSFHGRRGATPLWLATSPEYAMKRLLAIGCERIFQLGRSYRDGGDENSGRHAPEFTLLEWYRAFEGIEAIAADVETLLRDGAAAIGVATRVERYGSTCDVAQSGEWITVADAFRRFASVDLSPYLDGADRRFVEMLPPDVGRRLGPESGEGDASIVARERADAAYFRILVERIEPALGIGRISFLHAYPARHAALAEFDSRDARVARRFEAYVLGVELCNTFQELRDAQEQERRLRAESDERVRAGGGALPIHADFLRALRSGLPPCAGSALGVDRVHLLLAGAKSLRDVLPFPFPADL